MSNLFDTCRDSMVDVVTNAMGYPATWTPAAGGPRQTAQILYKDATDKYDVDGEDYDPYTYRMEYRKPFFEGLKDSVDASGKEFVQVALPAYQGGLTNFIVRKIDTRFDGNICIAYLEIPGQ